MSKIGNPGVPLVVFVLLEVTGEFGQMITKKTVWMVVMAACATALAGCGGSSSTDSNDTGRLSLGISDGPIHSALKVCITFDAVELMPESGDPIVIPLDPPEKVNLLDFQGANAMPILTNESLPAGHYTWLRLAIDAVRGSNGGAGDTGGAGCDGDASYIVMDDGGVYNLYVPSGANSGLKLVSGYTVPVNDLVSLTADFDLGKSITAPPGLSPDVVLRPTIRLVDNNEVGILSGEVASALVDVEMCEPAVHVFGEGVLPNPIEDGVDDPDDAIATARVASELQDDGSFLHTYSIGFLLTGNYGVAFTCDGVNFVPADGKPASILVGENTIVDFSTDDLPPME
jgi:hypothetical protein